MGNMGVKACWALRLALTLLACATAFASDSEDAPLCKPQGLLKLSKPYPRPSRLRFQPSVCEQHARCTCCGISHVYAAQQLAAQIEADPELSPACKAYSTALLCAACDAEVGTGQVSGMCAHSCDTWYLACRDDYFEVVEPGGPFGGVRPCTERLSLPSSSSSSQSAPHRAPLVCTRLTEVAASGAQLCAFAGFLGGAAPAGTAPTARKAAEGGGGGGVEEEEEEEGQQGRCFDPLARPAGLDLCNGQEEEEEEEGRQQQKQRGRRKRAAAASRRGGLGADDGLLHAMVLISCAAIVAAVAIAAWRMMPRRQGRRALAPHAAAAAAAAQRQQQQQQPQMQPFRWGRTVGRQQQQQESAILDGAKRK